MIHSIEVVIPPEKLGDREFLLAEAAKKISAPMEAVTAILPDRRSIDARSARPFFRLSARVFVNENPPLPDGPVSYPMVRGDKKTLVIGMGPAGIFAALRLIELGVRPILLERGKDHQSRRKDLKAVQQMNLVDPDSNYCFGEGGAGTYSDGKLYTRSTKRGDIKKILRVLVQHGADPDILVDAHPHIGSNRLYKIVEAMRQVILKAGGEVHFNTRVSGLVLKSGKLLGVVANDKEWLADGVILATGHSARDVFHLLHDNGLKVEAKPFAMGVRIEHPQELINRIRYHSAEKIANLPAAAYTEACQIDGRGVYSFCLCPGGIIIPAATAPGEVVVNGMSMARRDSPYANSGFVVEVRENDWKGFEKGTPFAGLELQQDLELRAYRLAGQTQKAPAQRLTDFMRGTVSSSLPKSSYIPGLTSAPLHEALPGFISTALKKAVSVFEKKMRGYLTEEAQIVATESRTSSPIRIPRDKETFLHPEADGLFPCGEGAGYAGGIVSAAMDGENCAEAAARWMAQ